MLPLYSNLKNISVIQPDQYSINMRMSGLRDMAMLPQDGSGYKKHSNTDMELGNYSTIDPQFFINQRINIRSNQGNTLTLTESKLPRPVVFSEFDAIRQQPAINLADVKYPMLNDLDDDQKEDVLGSLREDESIRNTNVMIEKLRNIQMQNPILLPSNMGMSQKQTLNLLGKEEVIMKKGKKGIYK